MNTCKTIIFFALLVVIFGGCGDSLTPVIGNTTGGSESGNVLIVPGGGGKTTEDLIREEGMEYGDFNKLILFHQMDDIDPEIVTTQDTLGMWDDYKFNIQGLSYQSTSNLNSEGFTDVVFLYYNEPITGPFKLSARVRMTAIQNNATSKGIQMGAFVPSDPPNSRGEQVLGTRSHTAGIQFRTSTGSSSPLGEVRFYYNNSNIGFHAGASTSGGTGEQILFNTSWKTEYILEVSRDVNSNYTYTVKNSKTGVIVPNTIRPANNPWTQPRVPENSAQTLWPTLETGKPVFAGFVLMGSSAEISQITIWDNAEGAGNPIFKTRDSEPAYVPVERFTLTFSPSAAQTPGNPPGYTFTRTQAANGITLTPANFYPEWADNRRVEWFMESCTVDGAVTISGHGDPFTVSGLFEKDGVTLRKTWPQGRITGNSTLIAEAGGARAVIKAVSRDLELDNFSGEPSADYSLMQTLAQFRFEVIIN